MKRTSDSLGVPIDPTGIPLSTYLGLSELLALKVQLSYYRDEKTTCLLARDVTDKSIIELLQRYGFKPKKRAVGQAPLWSRGGSSWIADWVWMPDGLPDA